MNNFVTSLPAQAAARCIINTAQSIGLLESPIAVSNELAEAEKMRATYERYKQDAERTIGKRLKDSEKMLEDAKNKAAAVMESAKASSTFVFAQLDEIRKKQEAANFGEELELCQ